MRPAEKIAEEAKRMCVNSDSVLLYAIDIARIEALSEVCLGKLTDKQKLFILTGLKWNDMVRYIRCIEQDRIYHCTNTAFNNWEHEMQIAEIVILLPGWENTRLGRKKHQEARRLGLNILHWKNSVFSEMIVV